MKHEYKYSLENLSTMVDTLKPFLDRANVVTLEGQLGAGKTTLVKEILSSYGITEDVTSPTFNYVNRYTAPDGRTFYHFDLYRLDDLDHFYSAGFDEYLYASNSLSIIEWPELVLSLVKENVCKIQLEHVNKDERAMHLECISE
ncbi:tRNA (adenosine(37)-N6)-threonylcarbamoyltransferase complex ATPase subunit type 1 TsaE [bacterium]|jgi:tRNA threonylcarbamoyladenosine biosynthesis protein TsaE|nr:tRNA (adenosine(37)-N6)-threonylcarbamoyltransferase complex ATPase subunit type 1 TsaE [bacterium]MBT5015139.1 tRNA (adenosine(37)-N6)-threonylcarbamoyltransferase complex ATPase subunit type 1 TsaE [bacterium]